MELKVHEDLKVTEASPVSKDFQEFLVDRVFKEKLVYLAFQVEMDVTELM